MNKHFAILLMYDELLSGKELVPQDCCVRCHFSMATFYRHISFLRKYFKTEHGVELLFDKTDRNYRLAKK